MSQTAVEVPIVEDETDEITLVPETRDEARAVFLELIRTCDKTVFRMPTSCEFFLNKYVGDFPAEKALLIQALRHDVPTAIYEENRSGPIDPFLERLTSDIVTKTGEPVEGIRWAVDSWAIALGKPPGTKQNIVARPLSLPQGKAASKTSPQTIKLIMTAIVTAGGFFGGLLANGGGYLVIVLSGAAADAHYHDAKTTNAEVVIAILLLIAMFMGGSCGMLGALMGWWMGRGNERPWASFAAAFGGACGTGCLFMLFTGPGLITAGAIFAGTFSATFTSAARGGRS